MSEHLAMIPQHMLGDLKRGKDPTEINYYSATGNGQTGKAALKIRQALYKKGTWTRADWVMYHNQPAGWHQPPAPNPPFNYAAGEPFSRTKYMGNALARRLIKFKPTVQAEYDAAKKQFDAAKKVEQQKVADDKLKTEQSAKEAELSTKIKDAEKTADASINQVMNQWNMQSQTATAEGGKILGMEKKTAMIVGGVAAGGLLLLAIAH